MDNLPRGSQEPIVCIFGRRGTGKTTLCRSLIRGKRRVLVWDPFREHGVIWLAHWREAIRYVRKHDKFSLGIDDGETESALALLALSRETERTAVVIEEVDLIARPGAEPAIFRRSVAQGRHWGVSLYCTSRRPAEVSRLLTSQVSDLYCFQTHEPRDVAYLRSVIGEEAEQLPTLPLLTCLHWTPDGAVRKIMVDPKKGSFQGQIISDHIISDKLDRVV